jgi:hypothetical protein
MRIKCSLMFGPPGKIGAILGAMMLSSGALAQTPPEQNPSAPPEVMEPPTENPAPTPDPSTGGAKPTEPLTKELKEGEGVLEPPRGIDPAIQKPVPEDFEGKTPIIPPPGEPGGRQDVQPK